MQKGTIINLQKERKKKKKNSYNKNNPRKPRSSNFQFDTKSKNHEDAMLTFACASMHLLLKNHLGLCPCLTCMTMKDRLKSSSSREISTGNAIKTMAKPFMVDPENGLIKYCPSLSGSCTKQLPLCTAFWSFDNAKLIFDSCFLHLHQPRGSKLDLQSRSYLIAEHRYLTDTNIVATKTSSCGSLKDDKSEVGRKAKTSLRSLFVLELSEPTLGWPLQKINPADRRNFMVLEEGIVSREDRIQSGSKKTTSIDVGKKESCQVKQKLENEKLKGSRTQKNENTGSTRVSKADVNSDGNAIRSIHSKPGWPLLRISAAGTIHSSMGSKALDVLVFQDAKEAVSTLANKVQELKRLIGSNCPGCKWFSYKELKLATNQFSSDNLIGEGGCSYVLKGKLDGKQVAVKLFKSYNEAQKDFSLEVDIMSSLNHPYIMPLLGLCVEENHLISVYDYFPRGSLEDNLQGQQNQPVLAWNLRFNIAVAVAKALNYLHNECIWPIIHRDIKSSNILLSDEFYPQLSDFGLSVREPADSTSITCSEVVGTFGYIAPEYITQGSITNKVDIYSFGVVLLELISGRKAIYFDPLEGQKSLVQWAKLKLEGESFKDLIDPKLEGAFDPAQMYRMIVVANLSINPSPHHRPSASQILKLLTEKQAIDSIGRRLRNPGHKEQYQDCTSKTSSSKRNMPTTNAWGPVKEAQRSKKLKDFLQELEE